MPSNQFRVCEGVLERTSSSRLLSHPAKRSEDCHVWQTKPFQIYRQCSNRCFEAHRIEITVDPTRMKIEIRAISPPVDRFSSAKSVCLTSQLNMVHWLPQIYLQYSDKKCRMMYVWSSKEHVCLVIAKVQPVSSPCNCSHFTLICDESLIKRVSAEIVPLELPFFLFCFSCQTAASVLQPTNITDVTKLWILPPLPVCPH